MLTVEKRFQIDLVCLSSHDGLRTEALREAA